MKSEFRGYANSIQKLGDADLVGVLKHTSGGIDIELQIHGSRYDTLWLAALAVYRIYELSGIPLEDLGKQLNRIVDAIQKQS